MLRRAHAGGKLIPTRTEAVDLEFGIDHPSLRFRQHGAGPRGMELGAGVGRQPSIPLVVSIHVGAWSDLGAQKLANGR